MSLQDFFDSALRSTAELPLAQLLAPQGVDMCWDYADHAGDAGGIGMPLAGRKPRASLGVKTAADPLGLRLVHVLDGGAAQQAGLAGGDVLLAVDGLKAYDLDKMLARYQVGEQLTLHLFRRDELLVRDVVLQAQSAATCRLQLQQDGGRWLLVGQA